MENLVVCLNAVLPLLCIMLLGYAARRKGMLGDNEVIKMNNAAFFFLLPCLLFDSIYSADLSGTFDIKLIIFTSLGIVLTFLVSTALALRSVEGRKKQSVVIMAVFRSNCAIIGLHLIKSLMPGADMSVAAIVISVVTIVNNLLGIMCMSFFSGTKHSAVEILVDIIKNPLMVGSMLGILFAAFSWKLPAFAEKLVGELAGMSSPLLLFLLGAFFKFDGIGKFGKELVMSCLGRLVVVPAVFLLLGWLLGFRGMEFTVLIGVFASPAAVTSFTMAQQMGADAELAGDIVMITSILCPFTIFIWSMLAISLGAI